MSIDIFKIFYFFVFVSFSLSTYTTIISNLKTLSILFEKIFFFLCLFLSFVRVRMYVCRYVHKINYPTERSNFSLYPTEQFAHARKITTRRNGTKRNPTRRNGIKYFLTRRNAAQKFQKISHPTEKPPKSSWLLAAASRHVPSGTTEI
jgi:hypothetical protein